MAEKARHILRLSIVFFFILAIFWFLMIFLLGLAKKHTLKNKVEEEVPIKQNEFNTWGVIPGELQYSWSRSYNLYEFSYAPTSGAPEINLKTVGKYDYDVTREFKNATWYPQKSVVSYNESYTYDQQQGVNAPNADKTMYTINMGAYDVWFQMVNKPKYFKAWQAMAQAFEMMLNSNYVNRLEAYNAYYYFFNNYADVQKFVLAKLIQEEQFTVYNDKNFGMGTITGLTKWIDACAESYEDPAGTEAGKAIVAYFATLNIALSTDQLNLAMGNGSMLMQIQATVYNRILLSPSLNQHGTVQVEQTIPYQWGFAGLTAGADINLVGVNDFYSVADLNDQFPYPPEFFAYVMDPTRGASNSEYAMNSDVSSRDYSRDLQDGTSFLVLDTVKAFYEAYETKDISTMSNYFEFKDWTQAELFHGYLDDMVNHFLTQNATYDIVALASLMDKNLNNTEKYLEEQLPVNVAARVTASLIDAAGTTCSDYFVAAGLDLATATTTCGDQDFTDVNTVKGVINATWYGDGNEYEKNFKTQTQLTDEQYKAFFSTKEGDFGAVLASATGEIAVQYNCALTTNCTEAELGALQWGSLGVTQNPKASWNANSEYMPVADTVAGWGDASWLPFGAMTHSVEYPQQTAAQKQDWTTIPYESAIVMSSKDYYAFGIGAFYNWQKFLISYYTTDSSSESMTDYQTAWGLSTDDINLFIDSSRVNIEDQIFGGAFADIKISDMLNGFVSDVAGKINGGDYILGNDFNLYNVTTPIQNDKIGFQSNVSFGMFTGSNGVDEIGQLRIINGAAYCNKITEIYNGYTYSNVTQQSTYDSIDTQELDDVSNGMQFPPDIEDDDQLKVFDQRLLKVMQYTHDSSSSVGDDDLRIDKFTSQDHGNDISFAYNLPLYQKPYGCYGCVQNTTELRTIRIDDQEYNQSVTSSDFYIQVQPDTGYMYSTVKNSTVFMIIGGQQNFIPYQQKVTPFPSLDPIYGAAWPLYDFSENLSADESTFTNKFDYVAVKTNQVRANVITSSVLAAFFLVLGIVAITIYKIKDPKRKVDMEGEEVLVRNNDLLEDN